MVFFGQKMWKIQSLNFQDPAIELPVQVCVTGPVYYTVCNEILIKTELEISEIRVGAFEAFD